MFSTYAYMYLILYVTTPIFVLATVSSLGKTPTTPGKRPPPLDLASKGTYADTTVYYTCAYASIIYITTVCRFSPTPVSR